MYQSTEAIPPAPGDRFPVPAAVPSDCPSLAIAPYNFTFRAAAKGRWLGLPLLALFAKEFAHVPPLPAEEVRVDSARISLSGSNPPGASSSGEEDPQATRDVRVTLTAYVQELQSGALWLHGREAECRAAGRAYENEIRQVLCGNADLSTVPWSAVCNTLQGKPETVAKQILDELPPRLLLRQKDVIFHRVLRREGLMPGGDAIHILRYDEQAQENTSHSHSQQRRLLVCCKPHGLPVHPSGRFRKNSVTSILSDILGGIDAHRYHAVPLDEFPMQNGVRRVAIRHKTYGFELIRVWIGPGYVSDAGWHHLEELLSVPAPEKSDEESREELIPTRGLKPFVVHRLDAATSGVLIFGLDAYSSRVTSELLAQKSLASTEDMDGGGMSVGCTKQYLARVCGRFDVEELARTQHHCCRVESHGHTWLRVDRPIGCLSHHDSLYGTPDSDTTETWIRSKKNEIEEKEEVEKEEGRAGKKRPHLDMAAMEAKRERMRQITFGQRRLSNGHADSTEQDDSDHMSSGTAPKDDALLRLRETLKRAVTLVRCLSYDATSDESVLECHLLTGRTHQVRVHLASLGHPICGDAKYHRFIGNDVEDSSGIHLHAWRYTLQFALSEEPEVLVAPPPLWAEA